MYFLRYFPAYWFCFHTFPSCQKLAGIIQQRIGAGIRRLSMKVKDLIQVLKDLPQDYDVLLYDNDDECYFDSLTEVKAGKVIKYPTDFTTFYWQYEKRLVNDDNSVVEAVLIR